MCIQLNLLIAPPFWTKPRVVLLEGMVFFKRNIYENAMLVLNDMLLFTGFILVKLVRFEGRLNV
jgi:hypothetical protein